jgi:hypothetical protein
VRCARASKGAWGLGLPSARPFPCYGGILIIFLISVFLFAIDILRFDGLGTLKRLEWRMKYHFISALE